MQEISSIVQLQDLLTLNPSSYVLIDASAGSKPRYEEQHLAGALYIDLNDDLADINDFAVGGRHPLPTAEQFARVLTKFGIDNHTHVVIYDDKNGSNAAARCWWMLKSIGHEKVQVINGGFQAAVDAGFPTEKLEAKAKSSTPYQPSSWKLPLADINEVEKASLTGSETIIDVRDANRYAGLTEPIDLVAGHIPNAINIPFSENLDHKGYFLHPKELREKYQSFDARRTIVHCGSGVTACHTLLAMDYAGLPLPKLYVGSWSEWSRNKPTG